MAKRINVLKTFDYPWPKVQAITHVSCTGPVLVKDEVAEYAIAKGYATAIEEPKPKTPARRVGIRRRGQAANLRGTAGVGPEDLPHPGRPAVRRAVDSDAG